MKDYVIGTARTVAVIVVLAPAMAGRARAQADGDAGEMPQSVSVRASQLTEQGSSFSWLKFGMGFMASIAAHEAGHILTSLAVGGDPSVGFDTGRPVVYSGIDAFAHPNKQFAFSASGMAVQLLINEAILDWPHAQGVAGEFERGMLASGIGTVLFYFTVGRNSSVGDVDWMARSSGLSKWGLTAIYGGIALSDVLRISLRERYAHFFAFPGSTGALNIGMSLSH